MTYLIRTANADWFTTTDNPEIHYKQEVAEFGWAALRFSRDMTTVERLVYMGSEGQFVWVTIGMLNIP